MKNQTMMTATQNFDLGLFFLPFFVDRFDRFMLAVFLGSIEEGVFGVLIKPLESRKTTTWGSV